MSYFNIKKFSTERLASFSIKNPSNYKLLVPFFAAYKVNVLSELLRNFFTTDSSFLGILMGLAKFFIIIFMLNVCSCLEEEFFCYE